MERIELALDAVVVRKRVRHDLGELRPLMESMRHHGLMNPIVITPTYELVAGHRRLESARRLGWKKIPCLITNEIDEINQLEMEIDENTQRKSLSSDELADAYVRLDRLRNPGFFQRLLAAIRRFFQRIFSRRERAR